MQTLNDPDSPPIANDTTESVKRLVEAVDPNKGRCLIENFPPERGVECCHVLSRKNFLYDDLLDSLEWFWGMRIHALNLAETCRNIFFVGASLHKMFEARQFILVPAEDVVQRYFDTLYAGSMADRNEFPVIEDRNDFEYRLVPLRNMENVTLIRQDDNIPLADDALKTHLYPFTSLPTLRSHIHPKFAIVSAGLRLIPIPRSDFAALIKTYPVLISIFKLYMAWSFSVPDWAESDPTYWPPDGYEDKEFTDDDEGFEDGEYEDVVTKIGRAPKTRRVADAVPASRILKGWGERSLSRRSVFEHTREMGKGRWDREALVSWSSECGPDGPPVDPPP